MFYGRKASAAHKFYGPNNATDLWHVKKVNPQNMVHLTEKPVELAVLALQYPANPARTSWNSSVDPEAHSLGVNRRVAIATPWRSIRSTVT